MYCFHNDKNINIKMTLIGMGETHWRRWKRRRPVRTIYRVLSSDDGIAD